VFLLVALWWHVDAKNRYKGPVRTLEEDVVTADPGAPQAAAGGEPPAAEGGSRPPGGGTPPPGSRE
jgi:hypothetical protein